MKGRDERIYSLHAGYMAGADYVDGFVARRGLRNDGDRLVQYYQRAQKNYLHGLHSFTCRSTDLDGSRPQPLA